MIIIHSRDDRSPEAEAARSLAKMAAAHDKEIESSNLVVLEIVPSAQCFGQKTQDVDLLVFYADYRKTDRLFEAESGQLIQSFCATIELKQHAPENVSFNGPHCSVRYRGEMHDVTGQSEKQKYSVKRYIEGQPSRPRAPYILNLIWLNRVNSHYLPASTSNIIAMDVTWSQFMNKCAMLCCGNNKAGTIGTFTSRNYLVTITKIFSQKLGPSKIDRKKMEAITTSMLDRQQYKDKIGQQLLIFRGRGGTGKTVRLLQMAYQEYNDNGLRVLMLTYNKALVADIKRTLKLIGTSESIGGSSISINSIYSFIYNLLVSLEVIKNNEADFLEKYEKYKQDALKMMNEGLITSQDIAAAMELNSIDLQWDLIMIDESQDWPASERDLLYRIYGSSKFVIADGIDQLVRGTSITDWRAGLNRSVTQVVPLHKSLRLKASLCQAVTHFAEQLEIPSWKLEPLPETHGGKVIVITGDPLAEDFHKKLTNTAKEDGNQPIDILLCVPPSWVVEKEGGRKESVVAAKLKSWGLRVWDAVDPTNREAYPRSLDQYRIVQYESCRGLEGWVVICFALDEFYTHKLNNAAIEEASKNDLFFDAQESAIAYAKKWLMIPLTRAIDTLVIHVSDETSFVGQALRELKARHPHDVIWIEPETGAASDVRGSADAVRPQHP